MATLTETFTNIADAIRSKTETTDKITPENMPAMIEGITTGGNVMELSITSNGTYRAPEGIDGYTPVVVNVPQDGAPPAEALVIKTGSYAFPFNNWNWVIERYGNQITTEKLGNCDNMFYYSSELTNIPFDINIGSEYSSGGYKVDGMFYGCSSLKEIPKITTTGDMRLSTMKEIFYGCQSIRELPEDIENSFNWSDMDTSTTSYGSTNRSGTFNNCYSLRKVPMGFLNHGGPKESYSYCIYKNLFTNCHSLDEVVDLPNPHYNATWGGASYKDGFTNAFYCCNRLKRLTFKLQDDGTPYIVNWNYQMVNLCIDVGYTSYGSNNIIQYNSGITTATKITDDATYQQLKDNPDSWTDRYEYSRYNRTSAVETINSLPDASAYVSANGTPNTIQFKGEAGLLTDGGAINTMTEEEIAVATAKGWTVSFV